MIGRFLLPVLVVVLFGLTGCTTSGLSASQLQDEVKATLERADADGPAAVELHCDGGLAAEVGAERDCTALAGEERVGLRVKARDVDPMQLTVSPFLTAEVLAEQIVDVLAQSGRSVDEGTCASALNGHPGAHADCEVWTDGHGHAHDVEATVTAVDGLMIDFTFEEVE